MKKLTLLITLLALIALFIATSQVFASPAGAPALEPQKTPGAQATQNANDRATRQAESSHGKKVNYRGIIASASAESLALTLSDGSSLTFILNASTSIKIPTLGKEASFADLYTGQQVHVQARQDAATGLLTAVRITAIPGKPEQTHNVGTVTAYAASESITILAKDGIEYTYELADEVKILPAERASLLGIGARVTIIAPRDVAGGTQMALGIVIHPAVP